MALIKCPECGKEVSDKAAACPNCGFPVCGTSECQTDFMVGISTNDSIVLYFNEKVLEIEQHGKSLVKDSFSKFRLIDVVKNSKPAFIISHNSLIKPILITKWSNAEKFSQLQAYLEKNVVKASVSSIEKKTKHQINCPKCKSINVEYMGAEVIGAKADKTKTTTSLNLNPLKPFTLFNHKEKIVKKGSAGIDFDRWRCEECGNVFTTIKK